MESVHPDWLALRTEWARWVPPVVIFNKSHSGSRLLAALIREAGAHLGGNLNESLDSLDVLRWVEYLVEHHYPDYAPLWCPRNKDAAEVAAVARRVFASHLGNQAPTAGQRWGWKLCETSYILPLVEAFFPEARYLHLIRDGRDVAFCDHTPPNTAFWKKVYFDTERIRSWRGHRLDRRSYERASHLFNARHWVNSVETGRKYGNMAGGRYLEVRYEDLCGNFRETALRIFGFLDWQVDPGVLDRFQDRVRLDSVGKFKKQPRRKQQEVLSVTAPLLLSLGYLTEDPWCPNRTWLGKLGRFFPHRACTR